MRRGLLATFVFFGLFTVFGLVRSEAVEEKFEESWESDNISSAWEVITKGRFGSTTVAEYDSRQYRIAPPSKNAGDHFLWMHQSKLFRMDRQKEDHPLYSTNVVKTTRDFTGAKDIVLQFWTTERNDEMDKCSDHYGDFGDPSCDGVLFTCDGKSWHVLWQAPREFSDWIHVKVNISANPNFCKEVTSDFAIKFMHYGRASKRYADYSIPDEFGIALEKVKITYDNPLWMGVVVDTNSYDVTEAEINEMVNWANDMLCEKTGVRVALHGVIWDDSWEGHVTEIDNYYHAFAGERLDPHLVVVLHADEGSRAYGGYASQSSDLSAHGYCNSFVSPLPGYGSNLIYGAVIDWDHRFSACGYDNSLYLEYGVWDWVSDVSLDDGSCRGVPEVPCVFNDTVGYYVCETEESDHPFLSSPKAYAGKVAIHELLHRFGLNGNDDHFATPTCDDMMGGTDYRLPWDRVRDAGWLSMCPAVWDEFADSYESCY